MELDVGGLFTSNFGGSTLEPHCEAAARSAYVEVIVVSGAILYVKISILDSASLGCGLHAVSGVGVEKPRKIENGHTHCFFLDVLHLCCGTVQILYIHGASTRENSR